VTWRSIESILLAALIGVIGANAVLLALVSRKPSQRTAVSIQRAVRMNDAPVAFRGVAMLGEQVTDIAPPVGPFAVRYVSSRCGFSESDTYGKQLAERLSHAGVPVTVLVPRAAERIPDERLVPASAPQVTFAPMEWIGQLRLTKTPTFLVFGSGGTLVWHHEGTLAREDIDAAVAALHR